MGKVIRASALVLLLACSAQAGWIQNDAPAPTPAPTPSQSTNVVQEPTTDSNTENGAEASLTDAVLSFLDNVLALF